MSRTYPGLPSKSSSNNRELDALLELAGIWKGDRGNALDGVVTFRDLGRRLVNVTQGRPQIDIGKIVNPDPSDPGSGNIPYPLALSGLATHGAFQSILLTWDGTDQAGYGYTEIWRSETDDLGTAVLVGTSIAPVFSDSVGSGASFYYWVRAISQANIDGPYNAIQGVHGATQPDVDYLLDKLTGEITESQLYDELNNRIDAADGLGNAYTVKIDNNGAVAGFGLASTANGDTNDAGFSEFFINVDRFAILPQGADKSTARAPFVVDNNTVYMNAALIKDASIVNAMIESLSADKLFVSSGTLAQALIGVAEITSAMIADAAITRAKIRDAAVGTAKIADAAITTAKIGDAQVDTLRIKEDAVVVPINLVGSNSHQYTFPGPDQVQSYWTGFPGTWQTFQSVSFTLDFAAPVSVLYRLGATWLATAPANNCKVLTQDEFGNGGVSTWWVNKIKSKVRIRSGGMTLAEKQTGTIGPPTYQSPLPWGIISKSVGLELVTAELPAGSYSFDIQHDLNAHIGFTFDGGQYGSPPLPSNRPCTVYTTIQVEPELIAFVVQR